MATKTIPKVSAKAGTEKASTKQVSKSKMPVTAVRKKVASKPKTPTNTGKVATSSRKSSKKSEPKLLSGGNPQIAKADGDAPVQAYIAALPGWKREAGKRLDAILTRAVPGVRKAVKWNSPFYGSLGKSYFLSFHAFSKYLKIAFFNGTSLEPMPPGESKTAEVRYLDLYEKDVLDEALFEKWVKRAASLPGWTP